MDIGATHLPFPEAKSNVQWISKLSLSVIAQESSIQGRVTIQFVVGRNGEIENVVVARSLDPL